MSDDGWSVWVAYYSDYSGISVFADEIDALRHAVDSGMKVVQLRHGEDLR